MIFAFDDLRPYLEVADDGYKVKENCPPDKMAELKQMNDEYMQNMGEALFAFP